MTSSSVSVNDIIIHSKNCVISSKYAKFSFEGSKNSSFRVNVDNSEFNHGRIIRILPVDILIPNLFYNVMESNRRFILEYPIGVTKYIVDMPLGYYNLEQWLAELGAQLATLGSPGTLSGALDPVTSILTLTYSEVDWRFDGENSTCNDLIGANKQMYDSGALSNDIVLDHNIDFSGVKYVILQTDLMAANTTLAGAVNKNISTVEFVSMVDTCHGGYKHHFIRTEGVRAIPFNSVQTFNDIGIRIVDINNNLLPLPENCEVVVNFLISFGDTSTI